MRLKEIRQSQNISQAKLSEMADVPKRTIEDIERFGNCKMDTAIKLAKALNVSLDELAGLK